jgi:hypothetical protein
MNLTEELFLCNYCLQFYSYENIRQVKLRAVEFIRDYLNRHLIKCKILNIKYIYLLKNSFLHSKSYLFKLY